MDDNQGDLADIDNLIAAISRQIEEGKLNVNTAIENEKTVSYWTIGSLIHEHLELNRQQNTEGHYVFSTLADRLHINKKTLYRTVQFYNAYHDLDTVKDNHFSWSHYKILVTVKSDEKRAVYERILNDSKLSVSEFRMLVKSDKLLPTSRGNRLTVYPGVPYMYRIVRKHDRRFLDLGFHTYVTHFIHHLNNFEDDSLVQVVKANSDFTFYHPDHDEAYRYTYKAYVTKIIDGDTIKVDIDLGFNTTTNQTLRLRGINAFEIHTSKGRKAKKFVVDALSNCDCIVIKTYHRDKFSRFLADVYYSESQRDIGKILSDGRFLNQELLDEKLAVKYYRY